MFKSLTTYQINLIKQCIAVYDDRFVNTVTDQDVFDFVEDRAKDKGISFEEAAPYCYDDYGVAEWKGLNI
jgi:hypothetical protein